MNIKIPPIVLDESTGNSMFLFGSSKSGKTTLLMEIYRKYYYNDNYITTLFAGNPQISEYTGFEDKLIIGNGFTDDSQYYIKSQHKINTKCNNKYPFVYLFDDQLELRFNKLLVNLILSYRNSLMSSMYCLQSAKILTPACRSNVNNVISFWFNSEEAIEGILSIYFADYFKRLGWHKSEHITKYRELTRDHNYLYLHILSETLWSSVSGYLIRDGNVV